MNTQDAVSRGTFILPPPFDTRVVLLLCSYLEFLPPDGLHVALLADDEGVGDFVAFWVQVGPAEGVAVLGDLCDHLVVAAFLDDVSGDR